MSWTIYLGMRSPKHEITISPHCWKFMYHISQFECAQKQGRIEKGEEKDSCRTSHNSTHYEQSNLKPHECLQKEHHSC